MPLTPGQVLNSRYRIVKWIGGGGFGNVYRAWDLQMDGPCALKENLETSPAARKQFETEARLLFNLRHPYLPRAFDHFTIPGQGQYLVMDYIEGQNLKEIVDQNGSLYPDQALGWIAQVCDALIYMHSRQPPVIHRDVKPENIKITPNGMAVLVDFGIAKIFDPLAGTKAGARAYTPGYASPEQHSGKLTDAQSDIYSLGATAYTLLTGKEPPDTNDITSGVEPAPLPAHKVNPRVPRHVSNAIERAMQLNRTARPASVAEFKAALFPPPSPATPVLHNRAIFLGMIILLVIAFVAISRLAARPQHDQRALLQTASALVELAQQFTPETLSPATFITMPVTTTSTHTSTPLPTPSATTSLTPTTTLNPRIALLSTHDLYVIAKGEADGWVLRQEPTLKDSCGWFNLSPQDKGKIALLTCYNHYVTSPKTGFNQREDWVLRQEPELGECGKFIIHDLGNGEFAFETCAGRYFTAGNDTWGDLSWLIVAETEELRDWERFTLQTDP